MMQRVNAVIGIDEEEVLVRKDHMFNRILKDTGVNLNADVLHAVELLLSTSTPTTMMTTTETPK